MTMNAKGYDAENLQALATFLAYGVVEGVDFDMGSYSSYSEYVEDNSSDCGTSGCALGWATFLWPKPIGLMFWEWSAQMLIVGDEFQTHDIWAWCFDMSWERYDNTRMGAAKRIQYLIDNDGDIPKWRFSRTSVNRYQSTEVKREQSASKAIIAELMAKIEREPKFKADRTSNVSDETETPQTTEVNDIKQEIK